MYTRDLKRRHEIHSEINQQYLLYRFTNLLLIFRLIQVCIIRAYRLTCIYEYIYTYRSSKYVRLDTQIARATFKKNENSTPRRKTTRARSRPPPAESGEASKVRHDDQTAHPMVDLVSSYRSRLQLKTCFKTDFSIAQTTGQFFCTCV